jgi:hypothetical protein
MIWLLSTQCILAFELSLDYEVEENGMKDNSGYIGVCVKP